MKYPLLRSLSLTAALLLLPLTALAEESTIDSGDTAWMLISTALVMLMIPGLALFYGGMVRSQNVLSTIMHSMVALGLITIQWVVIGYTLSFGKDYWGFIGGFDYIFLNGVGFEPSSYAGTIPALVFMMFQGMFAIITPALITGAFAERMKFSSFIIFTVAWVTLVYAPMAHWVWGGGWLGAGDMNGQINLGALDFAGGAVVHMNSGIAALAAAIIIGKRARHGLEPMESHNIPFVMLGAGLLWFGWFGFNAGSALAADGTAVLAFVVTSTAASVGALTWMGLSWIFSGKASAIGMASGAVAGLVAITPAAGFVGPMPAIAIGAGAGAVCFTTVWVIRKIRVDDALDVFAVHGMGGAWGTIATGIFAGVGTLGVYSLDVGRGEQILRQLVSVGATFGWSFLVTAAILLLLKYTIGLRVDDATEDQGLDIAIHGDEAYPQGV